MSDELKQAVAMLAGNLIGMAHTISQMEGNRYREVMGRIDARIKRNATAWAALRLAEEKYQKRQDWIREYLKENEGK